MKEKNFKEIFFYFISGIHLNNNLNHLTVGLAHHRLSSAHAAAKQGKVELPVTRAESDKIVLLVCNRACTGQQGKRCRQLLFPQLRRL